MRLFFSFIFAFSSVFATNLTPKLQKEINQGKRIAKVFCDFSKGDDLNKSCPNLDSKKLSLVATYLKFKDTQDELYKSVPKDAKCPVCGMFVAKYPKWAALMVVDGKHYYFDGIKDMLKFYFFDGDFKYDRSKIEKMKVSDYYTKRAIDLKDAFLVYDSKVLGPMGREIIAFSSQDEAKNFINDHGGKLVKFNDITPKMVLKLDGLE